MERAHPGIFPFGRLNTVRPMRRAAGAAQALVVGVYPSAFHVAWSPPPELDPRDERRRVRPYIGALAVDVEPVVFWDGHDPDPADLLHAWTTCVGFDPSFGRVRPGPNGPSGAGLTQRVLEPIGLATDAVAFTDAVPWFFVKPGTGGQRAAIVERFNPIAREIGVATGDLPARPSATQLVQMASTGSRRAEFRTEILEAEAPLIITLGQEALDSVLAVSDDADGMQRRLAPDGYGVVGWVRLRGETKHLLPVVHPGFQRQTSNLRWRTAFAAWERSAGRLSGSAQ